MDQASRCSVDEIARVGEVAGGGEAVCGGEAVRGGETTREDWQAFAVQADALANALRYPAEDASHELRTEATRLFIVGAPYPAVSPYEGVRAANAVGAQAPLFVNRQAMDVERFMAACGVKVERRNQVAPDHIAIELEFMAYLAARAAQGETMTNGRSAAETFRQFSVDHAAWMLEFAAALHEGTRLDYYRAVADEIDQLIRPLVAALGR